MNATTITMQSGFERVMMTLEPVAAGWEFSAVGFNGNRVGGVVERTFADQDRARDYANGYWQHLKTRGYVRVR